MPPFPTSITELYRTAADILILEDDPYYFLQEGAYVAKSDRRATRESTVNDFLRTLVPGYLRLGLVRPRSIVH